MIRRRGVGRRGVVARTGFRYSGVRCSEQIYNRLICFGRRFLVVMITRCPGRSLVHVAMLATRPAR
jgi:hypothetical protein